MMRKAVSLSLPNVAYASSLRPSHGKPNVAYASSLRPSRGKSNVAYASSLRPSRCQRPNWMPIVVFFLSLLAITNIAHAQRGDNILMTDGKTERGQILRVSPEAITVMIRERETPIKTSAIQTITFEKEPIAMRALRDALKDGQADQADNALKRIDAADIQRDFIKQDFDFLNAQLVALKAKDGAVKPEAAVVAMKKFVQRYPESWRAANAMETLGDLAMQTSEFKTAATMYARLGKISDGLVKLRSVVRSGDALRAMGDNGNAMRQYRLVLAAKTSTPLEARQVQMATVGAMAVAAAGGKADQAIAKLIQVIADNDASDVELFGRAYNALGDCYRSAEKPTDAALAYLHTDLLFYREADVHAESLYWLGKLWSDLGQSQRSTQAKNMLGQRYPTSSWARK